jgi:hypothetical protein
MKRTSLIAALLTCLPVFTSAQFSKDTLLLEDGRHLAGSVVMRRSDGGVLFRLTNGIVTEVPADAIDRVASAENMEVAATHASPTGADTIIFRGGGRISGTYAGNTAEGAIVFLVGNRLAREFPLVDIDRMLLREKGAGHESIIAGVKTDTMFIAHGRLLPGRCIERNPEGTDCFTRGSGHLVVLPMADPDPSFAGGRREGTLSSMSGLMNGAMELNSKKDPTLAKILAAVLPSTGHLYAGNWGRGILFLVCEAACVGIVAAGVKEIRYTEYRKTWTLADYLFRGFPTGPSEAIEITRTEYKPQFRYGLAALAILKTLEILDAGFLVTRSNERIDEMRIMSSSPVGIDVASAGGTSDGVALNLRIRL